MTDCAATKIAMLSGVPPLTAVAGPHNPSTADGNSLWMLAGPRGVNTVHGNNCFQPKPLLRPTHPATRSSKFDFTHPTPASKTAWYKQFVRSPSLVRNPPKVRHLKIASWNVEGLRDSLKYHLILQFMKAHHVDILLLQETHVVQTHTFIKDGFDFFFSGSLSAHHHGVGVRWHCCSSFCPPICFQFHWA